MKNSIQLTALLITFFLLSSFTFKNPHNFIGTFGVSDSNSSQIKLCIHSDHTFYYQDYSVSDHKISVNGRWTLKGKKLILNSNEAEVKFHNEWSLSEKGQVAKSRKGLCFYRLCKIDTE